MENDHRDNSHVSPRSGSKYSASENRINFQLVAWAEFKLHVTNEKVPNSIRNVHVSRHHC